MTKAYSCEERTVYPAGSFYSWRDNFNRDVGSSWQISDPRAHRQGAIAKLVEDDMRGVTEADAIFSVLPNGKTLPTMTYAELGSARVQGKPIILADENVVKEATIHGLASQIFSNYGDAIKYLINGDFELTNQAIKERDPTNPVKTVAFSGEFKPFFKDMTGKKYFDANVLNPAELEKADLLVVSFERGKRGKDSIALMGMAYALGIPIALHEPNPIVYPPLAGLVRRIFTGEQGLDILGEYVGKIQSNDITHEANVMYELFKKFNS